MKQLFDIIRRPVVTEKGSLMQEASNTYAFEVGTTANKIEIKKAVEELFNVKVLEVRTMNVRGKTKRLGRHSGKRSNWKKAYIRLVDGHSINLFQSAT